jgi:predicted cobalt transporter CbtA
MQDIDRLKTYVDSHGAMKGGRGLITGTIAFTLACLCLLGVLAFHFPQYLTTPELRQSYSVDAMRQLLFYAMVVAGGLALVNIIFNRTRWLSSFAFLIVVLCALLGGHKVQVNPNFPDHTPYIGLDWFILDLLGSSLIFIFIEKLFPLRKNQPVFRDEWQTDFQHFIVNHMIVGFVLLATNLIVHKFFGWAAHDGIRGWVAGLNFWVALFLIILVADLVGLAAARRAPQRQKHGLDGRLAPAHPRAAHHPHAGAGAHLRAGFFKGRDRRLHHHRGLSGGVQPLQRQRAPGPAALRHRHAQLSPLAPQPGR